MDDLRLRSTSSKNNSIAVKVLGKHSFSVFSSFLREFKPVYKDSRFRRIVWLGLFNVSTLLVLLSWCSATESMGLLSYTYLIFFDTLCLCICALSIWVEQKKPNSQYTFGYERAEVLAVFVSTTFICITSFYIVKKSIGRWIQQAQIHTGLLFPGIISAFCCHMLVTYFMKNKGLNLVVCASDSSWMQSRVSSFSQSISHIVPGIGSTSPRVNPFSLLGCVAAGALVLALLLVDLYDYHSADAVAGIFISIFSCATMYPISAYSGKILLQGTPPHIADLLDKCLREASTFDGVLEFRNEHFWLLGFDKIVGTIHVRIRRDANEQIVLSHLLNKLSSLVTDITIQVFKDEWAWSSTTRQILNESFMKFPPAVDPLAYTPSSVTNTVSSSPLPNSSSSKDSYSGGYPNVKPFHESKEPSHSYAAVPLPPSLTGSHVQKPTPKTQHFSIDMASVARATKSSAYGGLSQTSQAYQVASRLESTVVPSETYNKELTINPAYAAGTDFLKSYKS